MKASDSTNSLTGLTFDIEEGRSERVCFICLEDNDAGKEPLVHSSLLRTCGCEFNVHPQCWNLWLKDKSDYDCPICRRNSFLTGKRPTPIPFEVIQQGQNAENRLRRGKLYLFAMCVIVIIGGAVLIYQIVKDRA